MAELLDSGALQHWLCDPLGKKYQLCGWLLTHKVVPYVSHSTLALLHHHYLTEEYSPDERSTMVRLLEATAREMRKVEQARRVHPADFDSDAAMLWGKLAAIPGIMNDYFSFDLILAATAIRNRHRLVVGGDAKKMEQLAGRIPPDIGILDVISADDLS